MRPRRSIGRRSFIAQVIGGAALGGGAMGLIAGPAHAFAQVTDCDSNDRVGAGTGRRPRTGVTDRDSGTTGDPGGCGRGAAARSLEDQEVHRCTELGARIAEIERRTERPEGWSDEDLERAVTDQNIVALTAGYQENLGRQVMRREVTSEEGYRQLDALHAQLAPIAARYGIVYRHDMFTLAAELQRLVDRARAAAPQRAALHQEHARLHREYASLHCSEL